MGKKRILRYGDLVLEVEADDEYPFVSEEAYERKRRRQALTTCSLETVAFAVADPPPDDRTDALCDLVDACAYLTERQRYLLKRLLQGATLSEIAREYGITKQAVHKSVKMALAKIERKAQLTPYDGIAEVYRELVRGEK